MDGLRTSFGQVDEQTRPPVEPLIYLYLYTYFLSIGLVGIVIYKNRLIKNKNKYI